jgi:hypothetical protein
LNLKRLATDVVCYAHFSDEDFTIILKQTPNDCDLDSTLEEYRALQGDHDHFVMNITANKLPFVLLILQSNRALFQWLLIDLERVNPTLV